MVYFIRARTHFSYAETLYKEILEGKRNLTHQNLRDIFLQGLKALYALTEVTPPSTKPSTEEILAKILPTLSEEEKEKILRLKDLLFSQSDIKLSEEELLEEMREFLEIVKGCLKPIL